MSKLYLFLKAFPFDSFFFFLEDNGKFDMNTLETRFPLVNTTRKSYYRKSKFEIIANTVMRSHLRIPASSYPQRGGTFPVSFSWGDARKQRGEYLTMDGFWMTASLEPREPSPEADVSFCLTRQRPHRSWHRGKRVRLKEKDDGVMPSPHWIGALLVLLRLSCGQDPLWWKLCCHTSPHRALLSFPSESIVEQA